MKVLIFGATGMLGQALMAEGRKRNIDVTGAARSGADVLLDFAYHTQIENIINSIRPEVIINAAAITSLIECEKNPGYAYLINSRAVAYLAQLARKNSIYFVQVSTDHYYTGDSNRKHDETSPVYLVNEYARTKYAGECYALTNPETLIIRTNIVGLRGKKSAPTFVEWIVQTLKKDSKLVLFDDFYTSSIDVYQFSNLLFELLSLHPKGIFNLASRDVVSKRCFIESLAKSLGYSLEGAQIGSVSSLSGVIRAESLGLDVSKAEAMLQYFMPTMDSVINNIVAKYKEGFNNEI